MTINKYFKIYEHIHYTFLTGYWATWYISGTQHPKIVEHAPSCSRKVAPRNSSLFLWHNLPAHSTYVTTYLCSVMWPCLTNCTSDYENCVGFDCRRLAKVFSSFFFFLNPHPRICLLILEWEEGRENNIDWLPLVCALTGDWTCNIGICPDLGLNPQPFWCMGQRSNQLRHPARVVFSFCIKFFFKLFLTQTHFFHLEFVNQSLESSGKIHTYKYTHTHMHIHTPIHVLV